MPNLKEMSDEELLGRYTTWFDNEINIFEITRIEELKQEILARMARGKEKT